MNASLRHLAFSSLVSLVVCSPSRRGFGAGSRFRRHRRAYQVLPADGLASVREG